MDTGTAQASQSIAPEGTNSRILIVAEHASAKFGGEAILPLHYFRFLREAGFEAWLLVHARTRNELSTVLGSDVSRVFYIEDSFLNIACHRLSRFVPARIADFTLGAISQLHNQLRLRKVAKQLVTILGVTIVHQPIPVSPKLPSFMHGLGAPVVIGPMNGGMDYPPGYRKSGSIEEVAIAILRSTANLMNRMIPGKSKAACLLVANDRTRAALPDSVKSAPVSTLVENGVDLRLFEGADSRATPETTEANIIYVGRLVDFKRVDLLIDACLSLRGREDVKLHIVGDGPLRAQLEARATLLGDKVVFHGRLPQADVATQMARSTALVLPSMRECGGAVVLEAMASGCPVIAAAWGGPLDYLTDECGTLVAPSTPQQFVVELAGAISRLVRSPELAKKHATAARKRVELHFDWRHKTRQILVIYATILKQDEQAGSKTMPDRV
ncbi:MAG: glycosyltransferase family 4 protein [Aestuariivirga sp.]|nr:glycosyltransferase family 4 protein [Aestuariivirga sp.]